MKRCLSVPFLLAVALSLAAPLRAQSPPPPASPPSSAPSTAAQAITAPDQTGAPSIVVPATDNTFLYSISITTTNAPVPAEIRAGVLSNPEHPRQQMIPTLAAEPPIRSGLAWVVPIRISGLIPFGTSTLPIYNQNTKVETLHIVKNGLTVEPPASAQQVGDPLLLVLHNTSNIHYTSVRARLRFRDKDVCTFSVEQFLTPQGRSTPRSTNTKAPPQAVLPAALLPKSSGDCDDVANWTEFQIPQYSGASLRATDLPTIWFDAPDGYARAVVQTGTLTLRFSTDLPGNAALQEQILPVSVDFQPGTVSRSLGYFRVASWLLAGAIFSLLLRIVIPNYRRVRTIKDQLDEVYKITRGISDEVDSMLRVQLRVEGMSLETLRRSVFVISPGFSEVAQRVDAAIAALRRRLDYVRRLDAALNRRRLLITNELAQPTRIAAIDRNLNTASEELKSDQFRDQDWVFIQTALEAADKILGNPNEEDKSTFETILVQRWKSVAKQYGFDANEGWLNIPNSLHKMEPCFPSEEVLCPRPNLTPGSAEVPAPKDEVLPVTEGVPLVKAEVPLPNEAIVPPKDDVLLPKDYDINQWIKVAGSVRADLQITALELIRDFQFLAPRVRRERWQQATEHLIPLLGTPAFENLNHARSIIRELSEGISPEDVVAALQKGRAHIERDPQINRSEERIHLAMRFWQPEWNTAEARRQIVCEWRFKGEKGKKQSGSLRVKRKPSDSMQAKPALPDADAPDEPVFYEEKGWEVYHYVEKDNDRVPLEVCFYFDGKPITTADDPSKPLIYLDVIKLQNDKKYKFFWEQTKRVAFESIELGAALLVPLCALAISTADKGSSSQWWQLLGLGFGSDTIRNVLSANAGSKPKQP